jgi:hypothetical protein
MIYLTDRNSLSLSCREPESGEHHDSYNLSHSLNLIWTPFVSKISRFPALNADTGNVKSTSFTLNEHFSRLFYCRISSNISS